MVGLQDNLIGNVLQKIGERDAQREAKRRDLVRMLRDPDLADFVSEFVNELLNSRSAQSPTSQLGPSAKPATGRANSLRQRIRDLGPALPRPFRVDDVVDRLMQESDDVDRKQFYSNVRDALYRLVEKKKEGFKVHAQGKGGKHNTYEFNTVATKTPSE